jgi:predicted DNA-binding protein
MGRTTKHQQALYLEHERAEQLARLAEQTRIPKAALLREAVDDLLVKHKVLKPSDLKRPPTVR